MFRDDLAGKVEEIERRAYERYDYWLRNQRLTVISDDGLLGECSLNLNEGRTAVTGPPEVSAEVLAAADTAFQTFRSDVGELARRFHRYDELDPEGLSLLRSRLSSYSGSELSSAAGGWGQESAIPAGTSVLGKLRHATNEVVVPMADPEGGPVELRPAVWTGLTAQAFNSGFLLPFDEYSARQAFCVSYLANVIQVVRNCAEATQKDLLSIADACIAALEGEGITLDVMLFGGNIILGVVGFFALPVAAAAAVNAAGIALDILGEALASDSPPPKWKVEAGIWRYDAVYGAFDELNRFEGLLADTDATVGDAIQADSEAYFYRASFPLQQGDRPELPASIVDRGDDPLRTGADVFSADVGVIYGWGRVLLPSAAQEYQEAADKVSGCDLPGWAELLLPSCCAGYALARSCLAPALSTTGSHLEYVAGELVRVCDEYEWVDADNGTAFQQLKDDLEADLRAAADPDPVYRYPTSLAEQRFPTF